MAERRMFAQTIIDSDAFLTMPLSTQALYFHLSMRGDDEGFVNKPKAIMRTLGASEDDLKILIAKNFIIPFESGVVVIKHWKIHNYIRGDRLKDTVYQEEKSLLIEKENGSYSINVNRLTDNCQTNDGQLTGNCQHRLGKVSIGKVSIEEDKDADKPQRSPKFIKPSLEEIKEYCNERNNGIDAEKFFNHYESNGWMVGRNKMKEWKAAVITWEKKQKEFEAQKPKNNVTELYQWG